MSLRLGWISRCVLLDVLEQGHAMSKRRPNGHFKPDASGGCRINRYQFFVTPNATPKWNCHSGDGAKKTSASEGPFVGTQIFKVRWSVVFQASLMAAGCLVSKLPHTILTAPGIIKRVLRFHNMEKAAQLISWYGFER